MKIHAQKVVVTYADVVCNSWDYRVWENGLVEKWIVSDDNVDGCWIAIYDYDDCYEEILTAGLGALKNE